MFFNQSNGNSFELGSDSGTAMVALEGATCMGPSLHLFDVNPFQKLGNAL